MLFDNYHETYSITSIAIFLMAASFLLWCMIPSRKVRLAKALPGPPTLPIIGNIHLLKVGGNAFYEQIMTSSVEFGKMFRFILGFQPVVILIQPYEVEVLLRSTSNITKSLDYNFLMPWLGTGLLTSTSHKWLNRRKMLTPAFHFNILKDFLAVFNEQTDVLVSKLHLVADTGKPFNIFSYITFCALDIICESAMGCNIEAQDNCHSDYVQKINEISTLVHKRQLQPWLWPDWIHSRLTAGKQHQECLRVLHDFTEQVIKERSELYQQSAVDLGTNEAFYLGKKKRMAFLDLLLHQQATHKELTNFDIREEVDTFMFEGHDTTAAAVNWAIHLIGANPLVQEKLHKEMDEIFGDCNRHATMEDIKEMKYLDCVIKETLRLFPSVPMIGRMIEEDVVIDGNCIAKGTSVIIAIAVLHRCPATFPDPDVFNPDRFLQEKDEEKRNPYSYVPFSAGPRNCIGQKFAVNEEKIILSSILRKFKIESNQKREDLKPIAELILKPENGILITLTTR